MKGVTESGNRKSMEWLQPATERSLPVLPGGKNTGMTVEGGFTNKTRKTLPL